MVRQEETQAASRGRSAFRQDRRGVGRTRPPSRIPIPIRRNRVIDGVARSIRNNTNNTNNTNNEPTRPTTVEEEFPQDPNEPAPASDFQYRTDPNFHEKENPISARFYRRGDLTDEQFERLGFHRLPPGAKVVDNINEATNVEHILPDGTHHYIPASRLKADPRNPDNLISAQTYTDEEANQQGTEKEKSLENQRSRSILTRGGMYRLVYYPGLKRNSKIGGDFKYNLKEEVPFTLAPYGIYKKSEEEELTEEELDSNCLVDSLSQYPEEQEKLNYGHINTYTILDAWNFNPICEMLKCNIKVHRVSVVEKKARTLKFPSRSIQCDYAKTLEICNHEEHFFPYVENTGFLMSYIKKCGWKEGSNWREPTQNKHKNYFNSLNLVKQLITK